jgi:hypothetical protein
MYCLFFLIKLFLLFFLGIRFVQNEVELQFGHFSRFTQGTKSKKSTASSSSITSIPFVHFLLELF